MVLLPFFLFWLVGAVPGFTAERLQQVRVFYSAFTGGYVPLWIAKEKRLDQKYGTNLELVFSGRIKPQQVLFSGEALYTMETGTDPVNAHLHGTKNYIIIATIVNKVGLSIMSIPELKDPKDLKGKTLAFGRIGAVTDVLARYVLKNKLGLEPEKDVRLLSMGSPSNILTALERRLVQAASLTTPDRYVAKKMGFRELVDTDALGFEYAYSGLTTLKENVKREPDLTLRLIKMVAEGISVYKTNREVTLAVMRKYLRTVDEKILAETYDYFSKKVEKVPYPSLEGVKTIVEMMSVQYPEAKSVDANEIIDPSFVRQLEATSFIQRLYQ